MTDNNILERYVGGQIEIQNPGEGYLYRGEIASIKSTDDELTIGLAWCAKQADDGEWDVDDTDQYIVSLMIYSGANISEGRYYLHSAIIGETAVLFPPEGSRFDRTKVRGLARS